MMNEELDSISLPREIDRISFWEYVNYKIKKIIHRHHVFSVIHILFEEIVKDLRAGKKIKIANFGVLELRKMPPRKYHDVRFHRVMKSPGYRIMRFFLAPKIKRRLCGALDLDDPKSGD